MKTINEWAEIFKKGIDDNLSKSDIVQLLSDYTHDHTNYEKVKQKVYNDVYDKFIETESDEEFISYLNKNCG